MVEAYAEGLRAQAGPVQCTCKRKDCCNKDGDVAGPEDEAVDGQGGLVIGNRYSVIGIAGFEGLLVNGSFIRFAE